MLERQVQALVLLEGLGPQVDLGLLETSQAEVDHPGHPEHHVSLPTFYHNMIVLTSLQLDSPQAARLLALVGALLLALHHLSLVLGVVDLQDLVVGRLGRTRLSECNNVGNCCLCISQL